MRNAALKPVTQIKPNRHDQRHSEQALSPELMTKEQVAEFLQCSQRQVELLTRKERICQPVYLAHRRQDGNAMNSWSAFALMLKA